MAGLGEALEDLVRVEDRRRHELGRLAAGIAEHDALVAGALILVVGGIDALGDVGRLGVQQHVDLGILPVEPVLLVADGLDGEPGAVDEVVAGDLGRAAGLAGDHHAVGGGQRLGGDAQLARIPAMFRAVLEEGVDHLVGDAVAHLVRVAFGNGFAGEQIGLARHASAPRYLSRREGGIRPRIFRKRAPAGQGCKVGFVRKKERRGAVEA